MDIALASRLTPAQRDTPGTRRFERIGRLLADRRHDVVWYCGQWWNDYTNEFHADGICYRGVSLASARTAFLARLPALLARHRPAIVHVRPADGAELLAALSGAKLARAPLVVEWFGDDQDWGAGSARGLNHASQIITPSELVWTDICERGAPSEQTRIIPESIEFAQISDVEPAQDVDIVAAHRLDDRSHLDEFLLGLAELRGRDWQAVVVGDGPQREALETQAADLRIDDRVRFVGNLDRTERLAHYRGAHVFVQTAGNTHFATELLWGLACGCVGIVEYQIDSSAHELIEHRERGFRVSNPRELADAIAEAGEFERLTIDDSMAEYDHSTVINRYLDLYRELVGPESRQAVLDQ